jgi:hypothetical protein
MRSLRTAALAIFAAVAVAAAAQASEIGHFSPSIANIRDYVVPHPGIYCVWYNNLYSTDQINDENGEEIDEITVGVPPASTTLDLDLDLDIYVTVPGIMWASDWKILGATYAAYCILPLCDTSIGASLATATGTGRSVEQSQFGMSDVFLQPLWLGWSKPNVDLALGYGMYIPIGQYETETVTIPTPTDTLEIKAEASDNIGFGFWTHQVQGACSWYPWADRRMAVATALTWEMHGQKEDFDLTPGQNLTVNWGVSEYLPLGAGKTYMLDVGVLGYDSWQVTDDEGSDARNASVHDEVHAVGGQLGVTYLPWMLGLESRYIQEYAATDRFQGQSLGLNLFLAF